MRTKNVFSYFLAAAFFLNFFPNCFADTDNPTTNDKEKSYLIQIMNQLDTIQPLILVAKQEQLPNKRIQFHYTRYQDNQGQMHDGLLEDVQSIKAGIAQYLNQPAIEPRNVQPLQGDYLNLKPVAMANHLESNPVEEVSHDHGG